MSALSCTFERWSPGIGDPTVMGWVTVAAYGVTAILCFIGFGGDRARAVRVFGLCLGIVLLALMVNKQLDLQSALTAYARCLARAQGWYEDRRPVQIAFVGAVLLAGLFASLLLFGAPRGNRGRTFVAMLGFVALMAFVAIRAAGFHHMDALIKAEVGALRMNWILELGGLALIALNAVALMARR